MYTSCEPCALCREAIVRSGLGRVVFALSYAQWEVIAPPGADPPRPSVVYEGPALLDEARVPVEGYD
jgi:hypothetical protein